MIIVVLCKPCDISGGVMVTVLPDTGRHSNRTGASLNRASISELKKIVEKAKFAICQTYWYINFRVLRLNYKLIETISRCSTLYVDICCS